MESSVQVGKTLLAISAFSGFITWDIVRACTRKDKWIQGSGLTLTALSVQFLGYFDAQTVNRNSKEQELRTLVNKQLSVDSARLVFCTFLACVLPGVAFHSSGGRWSNIAAIAISLCLHIATEIYMLQNSNDPAFRNGGRAMFISSSVLLLVAAISLALYIGLAIINCKFTRDRLNHKIDKMLRESVGIKGMLDKSLKSRLQKRNFDAFKYWAIVRGCQQEFWLVSSAFTPAVVAIVSTCVAVVVAKAICRQYLLQGISNSVKWTLCFQCAFITTGWAILVWRWAVFLFLCVSNEREGGIFAYPEYTMAYGNRLLRLVYLLVQRAWNHVNLLDYIFHCKSELTYVWKALRISLLLIFLIAMLPPALFFILIYFLVLFNFLCWWLFSKLLDVNISKFPHAKGCISKIKIMVSDAEVGLASTEAEELLYVTESSVKQPQSVIDAHKRENYKEILQIIKLSDNESRQAIKDRLSPTGDVYSYVGVWKMAAVAAISWLAKLTCGEDSKEIVQNAMDAYKKAKDVLKFLDFPDNIRVKPTNLLNSGSSRAYQMSLEADIKMQEIIAGVKRNSYPPPPSGVNKVLRGFVERIAQFEGVKNFCQFLTGEKYVDEQNEGTQKLIDASERCVRYAANIEGYSGDKGELVDRVKNSLGDIIASCVLELEEGEVLPQFCKKWAEDFDEKNLIKALAIQEKVRAIKYYWSQEENKLAIVSEVDGGEAAKEMRCGEIIDVEAR